MTSRVCGAIALLLLLASCNSGTDSDTNGDGRVSTEERAREMSSDGYLTVEPGRWKMSFDFTDIDFKRLGNKEKEDLMQEVERGASGLSCLSKAEASKPGADFFGGEGAEDCTYRRFDLAGNRATMEVICGMGSLGKVTMNLDGTVGPKRFDFDTDLAVSVPLAGKIKMSGTMTGVHDGPCQGNE
jgi:hypothetical protein